MENRCEKKISSKQKNKTVTMIYEADEQLGAILLKHGLNDVSDADYKRRGKFRFGKTANSSPYVIFDF